MLLCFVGPNTPRLICRFLEALEDETFEDIVDNGEPPKVAAASDAQVEVEEAHEDVCDDRALEVRLSVLRKNWKLWAGSQREKSPVWAFFIPTDASLRGSKRVKTNNITCLLCSVFRFV